jgi:biotin operon repressor
MNDTLKRTMLITIAGKAWTAVVSPEEVMEELGIDRAEYDRCIRELEDLGEVTDVTQRRRVES